ncbi:MAG: hypothetical protein V2A54_16680 [Bacteroidota bacterium]
MKKSFSILVITALFVTVFSIVSISSVNKISVRNDSYKSIADFTQSKSLNVKIKGMGGHSENCLEFELKNTTSDTLFIRLEPGRRILSDDSTKQDILIVKEALICLYPRETKKIKGYGFCCCAHRGGPGPDNKFSIGYMAPPSWVKMAEAINIGNYSPGAIQHTVWCMSDNIDISSISGTTPDETLKLRKIVAGLKGIEIPWYTTSFLSDTARAFSGKHESVSGEIEYYLKQNSVISIKVRNKFGQIVKTLVAASANGPGSYTYPMELNVINWPKGEYEIAVYEDGSNLNTKKKFSL